MLFVSQQWCLFPLSPSLSFSLSLFIYFDLNHSLPLSLWLSIVFLSLSNKFFSPLVWLSFCLCFSFAVCQLPFLYPSHSLFISSLPSKFVDWTSEETQFVCPPPTMSNMKHCHKTHGEYSNIKKNIQVLYILEIWRFMQQYKARWKINGGTQRQSTHQGTFKRL